MAKRTPAVPARSVLDKQLRDISYALLWDNTPEGIRRVVRCFEVAMELVNNDVLKPSTRMKAITQALKCHEALVGRTVPMAQRVQLLGVFGNTGANGDAGFDVNKIFERAAALSRGGDGSESTPH